MGVRKSPKAQQQLAIFIDKSDYALLKKVAASMERDMAWLVRKVLHNAALDGWSKVQAGQTDLENYAENVARSVRR